MRKRKFMIVAAVVAVMALGLFVTVFAAACGDDDREARGQSIEKRDDRRGGHDFDGRGPGMGYDADDATCDGDCDECEGSVDSECDGDCLQDGTSNETATDADTTYL